MEADEFDVQVVARELLGITDPSRLNELTVASDLLRWIRRDVRRMQVEDPAAPPPAVQFSPGVRAKDFWRGRPQ